MVLLTPSSLARSLECSADLPGGAVAGPPTLTVVVEAGRLHVRQPGGLNPLYRFTPLRLAMMCGQQVPFASEWPEYLKPFVYRFVPLPALDVRSTPLGLPGAFGRRARSPHGLRPWPQATYNGWPLYYREDTPGLAGHHAISDLFDLVQVTVQPPVPDPLAAPSGGP